MNSPCAGAGPIGLTDGELRCDPSAYPLDVVVLGEPGTRLDELLSTLSTCPLLRVRFSPASVGRPSLPPAPARGRTAAARLASGQPDGAHVRRREQRQPLAAVCDVVVLQSDSPAEAVQAHVERCVVELPILVISTVASDTTAVAALRAGATSYLVAGQFTGAELLAATLGTAAGRSHLSRPVLAAVVRRLRRTDGAVVSAEVRNRLSRRERQIMDLVVQGQPNALIAQREFITEKTVRNHLNNVYVKLGVRSRSQAILVWLGRDHASG